MVITVPITSSISVAVMVPSTPDTGMSVMQ